MARKKRLTSSPKVRAFVQWAMKNNRKDRLDTKLKFNNMELISTTALSAGGTAASVGAITGMLWPSIVVGAIGAYVAYAATNEIPKDID